MHLMIVTLWKTAGKKPKFKPDTCFTFGCVLNELHNKFDRNHAYDTPLSIAFFVVITFNRSACTSQAAFSPGEHCIHRVNSGIWHISWDWMLKITLNSISIFNSLSLFPVCISNACDYETSCTKWRAVWIVFKRNPALSITSIMLSETLNLIRNNLSFGFCLFAFIVFAKPSFKSLRLHSQLARNAHSSQCSNWCSFDIVFVVEIISL